MEAKRILKEGINNRGMSLAELSRRTGIPYHRVRKAVDGETKINAKDFIIYCKVLKIDIR